MCSVKMATLGREAVRVHFVQRLDGSGLKRARDVTEARHAETMRRLVEYLAYLSPASLEALADQVLQAATGKNRDTWPSELLIRQMAEALEPRPFEMAPIVASWLASIEGPKAEAGGYLVQLYRHLRAHRRPILPYDLRGIRERAAEDLRREHLLHESTGMLQEADQRWLADLAEDRRRAQAIVDQGRANRDARQSGACA